MTDCQDFLTQTASNLDGVPMRAWPAARYKGGREDVMIQRSLRFAVCAALALFVTTATAQRRGDAEQLLQAATHAELVEGDLDKAIGLYRDVLNRFPNDRVVAAQALVKLGAAYEKRGSAEARGAYERVLRDYADQADPVRIARTKLQALPGPATAKAPETVTGPTYRLVLDRFGGVREVAHFSHQYDFAPDGRRFVFQRAVPERQTPMLFVTDADGALVRPLLREDTGNWWGFQLPRWAPDGKGVAYLVHKGPYETKQPWGIFVADVDTGTAVQIGSDFPDAHSPKDLAWTADGREITYVMPTPELRVETSIPEGIYSRSIATGETRLVQSTPVHWSLRLGGYSPDGRWLAFHQMAGESSDGRDIDVWMLPARGGAALKVTDGAGIDAQPAWAPEGGALYFVSDRSGDLNVWKTVIDLATGARKGDPQQVTFFTDGRVMYPRLFAAGRRMALSLSRSRTVIKVGNPAHPEQARELTRGRGPQLSPDGRTMYFIGEGPDQRGLFAMPVAGGAPIRLTTMIPAAGFDLSPDGKTLAYFARSGGATHLYTLPISGGAPRMLVERIATTDKVPIYPPRWSPDGSSIAYAQEQTLFTIPAAGGQPRKLAQLYHWEEWLWAPDGKSIAALAYPAPNDIAVVVVTAAGGEPRRLTDAAERQYKEGLAWHPDGQRLAYVIYSGAGDRDSELREAFVDGRPSHTLVHVPDDYEYVGRWTPDGKRFLHLTLPGGPNLLHAFDPSTGTSKLFTQNVQIGVSGLAHGLLTYSADGTVVAWAASSVSSQLWIAENFR
jgi:Tol biopolymer transport system component